MVDYDSYLSPYSWRYGSQEMRHIWSEINKRLLWRKIWVVLASVQSEFGLVQSEKVVELRTHVTEVNIARSLEIENEIQHDLMAELKAFAEQCPLGGGSLHLGATSMDIEDNTDALRLRQALDMVLEKLARLLKLWADQIIRWADTPLIAFTHLQPAEPSTLGYRMALYAQDLLSDWTNLNSERQAIRGKGFKGAVGTAASFIELVGAENFSAFEARLSEILELPFYPVTGQTCPRKQEYQVVSALAGMGASLSKFAFDLRLLQSPPIGELAEPFGSRQVGSSAMPFKRNPIHSEKINSLARVLAQMPRIAWDNAANSLLERTLDDSANRRSLLAEACLISDELLQVTTSLVTGLRVNLPAISRNLANYAPFAATESALIALVKAGADRQEMHGRLRDLAMKAWESIQAGQPNPMVALVCQDQEFLRFLPAESLRNAMESSAHLGNAPERARSLAEQILKLL
jgi:adenylosuccinate lyase